MQRAEKDTAEGQVDNEDGVEQNFIERDTLVSSKIKSGQGKDSPMIPVHYRIIGLYDKYYNKWWMTGDKKGWNLLMKDTEKKKYKVAMWMVEEGSVADYDDIEFDDDRFKLKDICKVVDGTEIVGVLGTYKAM